MSAFVHIPRGGGLPVAERPLHRSVVELWARAGRPDVRMLHPPNELADTDAKRIAQSKFGLWAGAPDLIFITPPGEPTAFLELKATGRYVARQGDQAEARLWIESNGHRWACVRSLDDAYAALAAWGLLKFQREKAR